MRQNVVCAKGPFSMIVKDGLKPIICEQASLSAVNPFLKQTQYISLFVVMMTMYLVHTKFEKSKGHYRNTRR